MAAGDKINSETSWLGASDQRYVTDGTFLPAAASYYRININRGVSLLAYDWTLYQRNASDSAWVSVKSGSVGSSGSAATFMLRWTTSNTYHPRYTYGRTGGNGAATMDRWTYGRGREDRKLTYCNNSLGYGTGVPNSLWKTNKGLSVTWGKRVYLTDV